MTNVAVIFLLTLMLLKNMQNEKSFNNIQHTVSFIFSLITVL